MSVSSIGPQSPDSTDTRTRTRPGKRTRFWAILVVANAVLVLGIYILASRMIERRRHATAETYFAKYKPSLVAEILRYQRSSDAHTKALEAVSEKLADESLSMDELTAIQTQMSMLTPAWKTQQEADVFQSNLDTLFATAVAECSRHRDFPEKEFRQMYWGLVQDYALHGRLEVDTQVLIDGLLNEDPHVRQECTRALTEVTGHDFGEDHLRWKSWWENEKPLADRQDP